MTKDKTFHDYIVYDILENVPDISSRAMFSGWAIYKKGIIFGIIAEGELYFKVDGENRAKFEEVGSRPFIYQRKGGKEITMSYWLVPEEILEDKEKLLDLMETSIIASSNDKNKLS